MDLIKLKGLKKSLKINELKILCDGALTVNYQDLIELQLLEDGRSLKQTDDDKILKLAESLLRFGIVNNLQVWFDETSNCYCFDAHHRKKALAILAEIGVNIPALPATRCLAKTKIEAKKLLLIKESRTSWVDVSVVPDYIKEIGFDFKVARSVIDLPEFSWGDVSFEEEDDEIDNSKDDNIPEITAQIFIKSGDLIELGDHRVLCGDSIKVEDVERLMGGEKADIVFTDPPYGIKEAAGKNKSRVNLAIANDYGNKSWDNKIPPKTAFDLMFQYSENQIIFGGNFFVEYLKNSSCWLVWDKDNGKNDFADCELIWTSFKTAVRLYKFCWAGMRQQNMKTKEKRLHPTQKPVGLLELIFNDYPFKTCFDSFLGSGSTLIAAEKTGRQCFGMEIDPEYCQVIVQRWLDFTGNDEIKINGEKISWSEFIGAA